MPAVFTIAALFIINAFRVQHNAHVRSLFTEFRYASFSIGSTRHDAIKRVGPIAGEYERPWRNRARHTLLVIQRVEITAVARCLCSINTNAAFVAGCQGKTSINF